MTFSTFIFSILFQIRFIRPYWYTDYKKTDAINSKKDFGLGILWWSSFENRRLFYHTIYLPRKINVDLRNNTISAKVRKVIIQRRRLERDNTPPKIPEDF